MISSMVDEAWLDPHDESLPPAFAEALMRCIDLRLPPFEVLLPTDRLQSVAKIRSSGKVAPVNLMQDRTRIVDLVVAHVRYLAGEGVPSIVDGVAHTIFQATGHCVCGWSLTNYSGESDEQACAGARAFMQGQSPELHAPGCSVAASYEERA